MSYSVGIITYHAAYNFGSVLQAYATQMAYIQEGADAYIINYRPQSQVSYYEPLYRTGYSFKTFLQDSLLFPVRKDRLIRSERFERFINTRLHLTERVDSPKQLQQFSHTFDIFVSGSDQILNIHSNEYQGEGFDAMKPYLLDFTQRHKVSYASSPANMTDAELMHIVTSLKKFSMLSAREQDTAKRLSRIMRVTVKNVLDPTLLLSRDRWRELVANAADKLSLPNEYAVYYTLDGTKSLLKQIRLLRQLSDMTNMPVVIVSPFAFFPASRKLIDGRSIGPAEFIQLLDNASLVVTDSYHGTLFSMNLETPFLSISNGKGSSIRKDQVLERMHVQDSIVMNLRNAVEYVMASGIPKTRCVDNYLIPARESSFEYIRETLQQ